MSKKKEKTKDEIVADLAKKGEKYLIDLLIKYQKNGIDVKIPPKPIFSEKPNTALNEAHKYLTKLANLVLLSEKKEKDKDETMSILAKNKIDVKTSKIGKVKTKRKPKK